MNNKLLAAIYTSSLRDLISETEGLIERASTKPKEREQLKKELVKFKAELKKREFK